VQESFSYLSVLLAIVLGLAITQVLLGLRGLILTRAKVKLNLPTLIWAGLTLLLAIQTWWADFSMRTEANWTFGPLLVILLQAICGTTISRIKVGSSVPCWLAWSLV